MGSTRGISTPGPDGPGHPCLALQAPWDPSFSSSSSFSSFLLLLILERDNLRASSGSAGASTRSLIKDGKLRVCRHHPVKVLQSVLVPV